jgi:hypothetical protein
MNKDILHIRSPNNSAKTLTKLEEMIEFQKKAIILRELTATDLHLMPHLLINNLSIDQDLEALATMKETRETTEMPLIQALTLITLIEIATEIQRDLLSIPLSSNTAMIGDLLNHLGMKIITEVDSLKLLITDHLQEVVELILNSIMTEVHIPIIQPHIKTTTVQRETLEVENDSHSEIIETEELIPTSSEEEDLKVTKESIEVDIKIINQEEVSVADLEEAIGVAAVHTVDHEEALVADVAAAEMKMMLYQKDTLMMKRRSNKLLNLWHYKEVAMISKMLLLLSTAMLLITRADFILKGTVISNDFLVL